MRVGADIGAICRKCGDVWHVVVAVADGRIAKVECKQCGGRHRYKPAGGEAVAPRRRTSGAGTAKKAAARGRGRNLGPVVEADLSRPVRDYRPSETFSPGDRMRHPKFGEGIVQAVVGPTKVQVLFDAEQKTLVHARG